jgi:hypothetical protein
VTRTQEIRAQIAECLRYPFPFAPILAIDPDAHTPGAAYWFRGTVGPVAFAWGGNRTGAALATPDGARGILATLSPGLVLIEAPLASGGAHAASMHGQNLVRGGWSWLAQLAGATVILIPPGVWQPSICGPVRGEGAYKRAYKAHAAKLLRTTRVNEDAAAALCMLDFALRAIGEPIPAANAYAPDLTRPDVERAKLHAALREIAQ